MGSIFNQEDEFSNDASEEGYRTLYPKIARDFVHRDVLREIIRQVLERAGLDPSAVDVDNIFLAAQRGNDYLDDGYHQEDLDVGQ